MRYYHLLVTLLLIALAGCTGSKGLGSGKGGVEITRPADRKAFLDRFKNAYYDLGQHSFAEADCDIHNSYIDELDTALPATLPERSAVLDRLHHMPMRLHIPLQGTPTLMAQDEIGTGDAKADSLVGGMLAVSSEVLVHGVKFWKIFATGNLATPSEPLLSSYKMFRDSSGYRIEAGRGIMEMVFDSTMRMTMLSSALSDGTTVSKLYFGNTPGGLILERTRATFTDGRPDMSILLQCDEVDGVLLPSKVIATVEGSTGKRMTFTFTLSGYHVVKS